MNDTVKTNEIKELINELEPVETDLIIKVNLNNDNSKILPLMRVKKRKDISTENNKEDK